MLYIGTGNWKEIKGKTQVAGSSFRRGVIDRAAAYVGKERWFESRCGALFLAYQDLKSDFQSGEIRYFLGCLGSVGLGVR